MQAPGWDPSVSDVRQRAAGAGWIEFAATVLIISGVFKIFDGLWAFAYDDELSEGVETIVFEGDLAAWGWVWIVVGVLLGVTGIAVANGSDWARWAGIVVAGLAAVSFFPWIYYQPLWTVLSVGLAVLTIYALGVYGGSKGVVRRG